MKKIIFYALTPVFVTLVAVIPFATISAIVALVFPVTYQEVVTFPTWTAVGMFLGVIFGICLVDEYLETIENF